MTTANIKSEKYFQAEFDIPEYVKNVARVFIKEGYRCLLVGGALRDVVLGIEPDDYDLATDAKPDVMLEIFPKAVSTGVKFGTVTVLSKDAEGEVHEVQVTTFRREEKYLGGRWPSLVEFVDDLDQDLKRRDFTFNAMALDFASCKFDDFDKCRKWQVYDPFDGRNDLRDNKVRAVGDPVERFTEDGLRAYKACRMAAQLGFVIEPRTLDAIKKTIPVAAQISTERIRDEFMKMIKNSEKPSIGVDLMLQTGLLKLFLPELVDTVAVDQPIFHKGDVYSHVLKTLDLAPIDIRLAALLHDISKPATKRPDGHFYGHDVQGEKVTREIMRRLKFSNAEIERVSRLVRYHMFYYPVVPDDATQRDIEEFESKKWTDAAVRRFIARVGEENIDDLFALRIADGTANPFSTFKIEEVHNLQERISEVRQKDMALKITDLKINGNDLLEMGVKRGPEVGRILNVLLEKVLDDPGCNDRDQLLALAKKVSKNIP